MIQFLSKNKGENPRFIVTSITNRNWDSRTLYEDFYGARGEMENRIKEQQLGWELGLFADRTSTQETHLARNDAQ